MICAVIQLFLLDNFNVSVEREIILISTVKDIDIQDETVWNTSIFKIG